MIKIFLRHLFFLLVFCVTINAFAQAQTEQQLQHYLLQRVEAMQIKEDDFFLKGIYPSYINNKQKYTTKDKDLTIFYNALIDETLQQIYPELTIENKAIVDKMYAASLPLYPRFKNQKGRNSYNFWVRDSLYTFPYSWWIPLIKKDPHVPDDMDDTSISHLALNSSTDSAKVVHALFQGFINRPEKPLKTVDKKYRNQPAYSTWFGKKFPVVFDISVLANTLFFVQTHNLDWTSADSASLNVIVEALDSRDYFKNARLISPYYGKPAIIMYHLSRLMRVKPVGALEERKQYMIEDTKAMYITSQSWFEKIILSAALKKWGVETGLRNDIATAFEQDENFIQREVEQSDYPYFIGNIPSYFPYGLKKVFTKMDALFYYHYCPAYNNVILLEYLVE